MVRRCLHVGVTLVSALTLSGCLVLAVEPFSSPDVQVSDPLLEGTWAEKDEDFTWSFARDGSTPRSYILTDVRAPETFGQTPPPAGTPTLSARFDATLFKLDGALFLDLLPQDCRDCKVGSLWLLHTPPMHSVFAIRIAKDQIEVAPLDEDHVLDLLKQGRLKVPHTYRDGGPDDKLLLLTAPTRDLQGLLRSLAGDAKAFGDWALMKRK